MAEGQGKGGGRKSKYTPELAQKIFDVLSQTGRDEDGWKAGGISCDTFYAWISKFPEFSEGVKKAKAEWRETCPEVLVRQANKAFADYLHGRMTRVVYTKEEGTNPKTGEPYEKEITQHVPVGIPRWAIERVLGTRMNEIDALCTLVEAGWMPRWVIQVAVSELNEVKTTLREMFNGILPDGEAARMKPGLSEEAASVIRARILGIAESNKSVESRTIATQRNNDRS